MSLGLIGVATVVAVSTGTPPESAGHELVYAPDLGAVLLVNAGMGGSAPPSRTAPTRLWAWNGTDWRVIDSAGPPVRNLAGVAYDSRRRVLVMHGGSYDVDLIYGETWEWSAAGGWRKFAGDGPGRRDHSQMAFDERRGVAVLFGGSASVDSAFSDVWEFDGIRWRRSVAQGPGGRIHHVIGYDPRHGIVVAGGSRVGAGALADAWAWNGERWTQLPSGPWPRAHARMAFDGNLNALVVAGGFGFPVLAPRALRDTSWGPVPSPTQPSARYLPAMAYDAARRKLVLFGGGVSGSAALLADTWEFDGRDWVKR